MTSKKPELPAILVSTRQDFDFKDLSQFYRLKMKWNSQAISNETRFETAGSNLSVHDIWDK